MLRSLTVALLVTMGLADAATLKVPQQYGSIQLAVDAAMPGDTVLVKAGTYVETVKILTAGIHLKSQGKVILDALPNGQASGAAIRITATATGARVTGFTVRHARTGIGSGYGVWADADAVVLTKLHVISCELAGIVLGGNDAVVRQCVVEGCSGGIVSTNLQPTIENNVVRSDSLRGIEVGAKYGTIRKNRIETIEDGPGIFVGASSVSVLDNQISNVFDGHGVEVDGDLNVVAGNHIRAVGNDRFGVRVTGTDNLVRANRISDCVSTAIYVQAPGVGAVVDQNVIDRCGCEHEACVWIAEFGSRVTRNVVRGSDGQGIHIETGNPVVDANRVLSGNVDGIYFAPTAVNATVTNNVVKQNLGEGIDLRVVPAVFTGNVLKHNRIDLGVGFVFIPNATNHIGTQAAQDID